jgi:hypothetical protein
MRPNPSDPERTVSVAIVATRLRSERLGELRPEPGPRRIGETRDNLVGEVASGVLARHGPFLEGYVNRRTCATAQARTTRPSPDAPGPNAPRYASAFREDGIDVRIGGVVGIERAPIVGRGSVRPKKACSSGNRVGGVPDIGDPVPERVQEPADLEDPDIRGRCGFRLRT